MNKVKAQMRENIRNRRKMLTKEQLDFSAEVLKSYFVDMDFDEELTEIILKARTVALYKAVNGELSCEGVDEFFRKRGCRICYPVVNGDTMDFRVVNDVEADFCEGKFHIKEPLDTLERVNSSEIDLMIVPAILYNEEGYRLGQGGGYYDAYLNSSMTQGKAPYTIGVCYDFQICSKLPIEEHDYPVDCVLSVIAES